MSHAATNWAFEQRGIKPALKVVLFNLCDRYHPDNGCFPSQETLAADCEVSRSALNGYLDELEERGLIVREQRRAAGSKRQERTRYRFPFEADFKPKTAEKPCPENGHGAESEKQPEPSPENGESRVQNMDSNPVREPVREPVMEREGASGSEEEKSAIPGTVEFRKRLQRFLSGAGYKQGEWPDWANGAGLDWIMRHFAALPEADRKAAEDCRDAFLLKSGGRNVMGAGNYFKGRVWEILSDVDRKATIAKTASDKPENWAKAYGPAHASVLFRILRAGPDHPHLAPNGGLWLSSHIRSAWPRLAAFWQNTDLRGGVVAPPQDIDGSIPMEFATIDSDLMALWKAAVRVRNLPDLRIPDGMAGHYFPKGGPDGPYGFDNSVRGEGDEHAA
ncbi:helix-turn-helix domain-containing protein [Rhizobium sp. Leaf386]|uniref:helix-turn-helix domain-containing protein n=1 Tax=Rhizobium sp. Leaf386 TaxID=1736359 RepID=UPI000715BB25|nr:helix-turn-helix domain-containing protein [Rhizobium sp. Leaf386]KQS90312.1 hypothetical protein ASG50_07605 [Rhizobium sp. Leaf386]